MDLKLQIYNLVDKKFDINCDLCDLKEEYEKQVKELQDQFVAKLKQLEQQYENSRQQRQSQLLSLTDKIHILREKEKIWNKLQ